MPNSTTTFEPRLILEGHITGTSGPLLVAQMPLASLGSLVEITLPNQRIAKGVISAFKGSSLTIAPLDDICGVRNGSVVRSCGGDQQISVRLPVPGSVVDALGRPLNGSHLPLPSRPLAINATVPEPLKRKPIRDILYTGVSAIDGFSPIGHGQRIALAAPAGTGKSTLLAMITRNAAVDHVVIGLIGERGREVQEFIDETLNEQGLTRSTVVVATSDETPMKKLIAAKTAFSISEELRSQGKRVLLIIDSLTRLARAMRDIGLANGELPVRHGYPASVLVELPRLLERAGNDQHGSITAIFSLLQEETHGQDYLSHEVASLLDGHILLDSSLAERQHYPAIDVTRSLSRLTQTLLSVENYNARTIAIAALARLSRDKDILLFGGTPDEQLTHYISLESDFNCILRQRTAELRTGETTLARVVELARKIEKGHTHVREQKNDTALLPPRSGQQNNRHMSKDKQQKLPATERMSVPPPITKHNLK